MAILPSASGPSAPLSSEESGELSESIAAAKKAPASGAGVSRQPVPIAVGRAQLASTRAHASAPEPPATPQPSLSPGVLTQKYASTWLGLGLGLGLGLELGLGLGLG